VRNFVLKNLQHDVVRDRVFPLGRFQDLLIRKSAIGVERGIERGEKD
jgi:tRNA U34 2-thiouridine synthase MnmA/TrmU